MLLYVSHVFEFHSSYSLLCFELGYSHCSTAFLIGPMQQLSMMMDPVRAYATSMYVGCVVLALICALWVSVFSIQWVICWSDPLPKKHAELVT